MLHGIGGQNPPTVRRNSEPGANPTPSSAPTTSHTPAPQPPVTRKAQEAPAAMREWTRPPTTFEKFGNTFEAKTVDNFAKITRTMVGLKENREIQRKAMEESKRTGVPFKDLTKQARIAPHLWEVAKLSVTDLNTAKGAALGFQQALFPKLGPGEKRIMDEKRIESREVRETRAAISGVIQKWGYDAKGNMVDQPLHDKMKKETPERLAKLKEEAKAETKVRAERKPQIDEFRAFSKDLGRKQEEARFRQAADAAGLTKEYERQKDYFLNGFDALKGPKPE